MARIRFDTVWGYWFVTDVLLIAGLAGWFTGYLLATALCIVQVGHFFVREGRSLTAFPVQVRLAYLALLLVALWEPLRFIYVLQVIGTTAMVVANYCFLARFMALMPWNRDQPLSWGLVVRTFLSGPVAGRVKA